MKNPFKTWLLILFGIVFILFLREYFVASQTKSFQIFCEENNVLIKTPQNVFFTFDEKNSSNTKLIQDEFSSFLNKVKTYKIEELELNKELFINNFSIQVFSPEIARGKYLNYSIWFLGDFSDKDEENIKTTPISLQSDFWIIKQNKFPDFLPTPKKAILFLGSKHPSKKLQEISLKNEIPLISVKETNGFSIELVSDNWKLRTRK